MKAPRGSGGRRRLEEGLELGGEEPSTSRPLRGTRVHRPEADPFEREGDLRRELAGRVGLPLTDHAKELLRIGVHEGRGPRQAFVEDDAEGVDVEVTVAALLAHGLLGRHVERCPQDVAGLGQALAPGGVLGEPEIRHPGTTGMGIDQDVGWLEVAVKDPLAVGVVDGAGQLEDHSDRVQGREGPLAEDLAEGLPVAEIHRVVAIAALASDVVDAHDARVLEPGGDGGFALEAGQRLGVVLLGQDDLEREPTREVVAAGQEHDAHRAAAHLLQEEVGTHAAGPTPGRLGGGREEVGRGLADELLALGADQRALAAGAAHSILRHELAEGDRSAVTRGTAVDVTGELAQELADLGGLDPLAERDGHPRALGLAALARLEDQLWVEQPALNGRQHDRLVLCVGHGLRLWWRSGGHASPVILQRPSAGRVRLTTSHESAAAEHMPTNDKSGLPKEPALGGLVRNVVSLKSSVESWLVVRGRRVDMTSAGFRAS